MVVRRPAGLRSRTLTGHKSESKNEKLGPVRSTGRPLKPSSCFIASRRVAKVALPNSSQPSSSSPSSLLLLLLLLLLARPTINFLRVCAVHHAVSLSSSSILRRGSLPPGRSFLPPPRRRRYCFRRRRHHFGPARPHYDTARGASSGPTDRRGHPRRRAGCRATIVSALFGGRDLAPGLRGRSRGAPARYVQVLAGVNISGNINQRPVNCRAERAGRRRHRPTDTGRQRRRDTGTRTGAGERFHQSCSEACRRVSLETLMRPTQDVVSARRRVSALFVVRPPGGAAESE